ncbi:MAG: hypothetical protein FJ091_16805 [Deltaproteobacteria bacterium]|nr:hypothetical protein [Deltaproteobacteria bacterium]
MKKLGGISCAALGARGCTIYARRPHICRAYQCLWLQGKLDIEDRPDRLGAVLDVVFEGAHSVLAIREAKPGALAASARLRAIAVRYREAMPVRISGVEDVLASDAPVRTLLPGGEELLARGEVVTRLRDGRELDTTRAPWLERGLRRLALAWQRRRIRGYGDGSAAVRGRDA